MPWIPWLKQEAKVKGSHAVDPWSLSTPLLQWSETDAWTIGHAVEGLLVTGASGSGKTSTSGTRCARSFLEAGFGGLVLTAKQDEVQLWIEHCRATGRENDLILFSPEGPWCFNPLDFELNRKGAGAGHTENLVNLFTTMLEIADRTGSNGGGREDESYWRKAARQLVRNFCDLLILATGHVSIPDLYRAIISSATSLDQAASEGWKRNSYCFKLLVDADAAAKSSIRREDFKLVADYILLEYPGLSDKTRSVIVSSFTSCIDVMNRGVLRQLFCGRTNFSLNDSEQGKVIVVALPVKEFGEVGVIANVLMKYCWQLAVERRDVKQNPRPVFLYADEAQFFFYDRDFLFQSTCRSSRVATVYLTQNLSNVLEAMGGEGSRAKADSLLGNLACKVFHANADPVTNEWAASIIGKKRQFFMNANHGHQSEDWLDSAMGLSHSRNVNAGVSEQMDYEVQPSAFHRLRTGGPANDRLVDAIVFQNGRVFGQTGRSWLPVTFRQSD
ncbi:MAG: TraM recognition domain-containing protein [Planctomycetes bacterium]|nr:TraM recognition domain-containing protein [Planctomycetota bacterium]